MSLYSEKRIAASFYTLQLVILESLKSDFFDDWATAKNSSAAVEAADFYDKAVKDYEHRADVAHKKLRELFSQ